MRVISVPGGLRSAATVFFLCVPLAVIETAIVARAPWWRLPLQEMAAWGAAVFLVYLPLAVWLMSGRRWALRAIEAFLLLWCILSAWVAIRMRLPLLGFFTLLLAVFFGVLVFWMRREMGRSFFDPRMEWYQSLPKPVPWLKCRLGQDCSDEVQPELRVSRIDEEGAFVICDPRGAGINEDLLRMGFLTDLVFVFRDRQVHCRGVPVGKLAGGAGAGFRFNGMSPDMRKDLSDFIETLRGEGYVE